MTISKKSIESLGDLALDALRQIDRMQYETEMKAVGIRDVIRVGIAFRGKETRAGTE